MYQGDLAWGHTRVSEGITVHAPRATPSGVVIGVSMLASGLPVSMVAVTQDPGTGGT